MVKETRHPEVCGARQMDEEEEADEDGEDDIDG
jgi:hypothetical protein